MSDTSASLSAKLAFWGALLITPVFYFGIASEPFAEFRPLLHLGGLLVGMSGFVALLIWNALLRKSSLASLNFFLACWMMMYIGLMIFFPRAV